jgi:murein L,D-transpeptidase YcbB/YkuD
MFVARVREIVINPSWNIPPSIARNELLPRERNNPGYLESRDIIADRPDGMLRQRPGDDNALGRIKLEMPNRFNSYMHDTPSKNLFALDERYFSHGCIRVQEILSLASYLLTRDTWNGLDDVNAAIDEGRTRNIALRAPLAVYVLYWTAIVREDGAVGFRNDVYRRDERLLAALQQADSGMAQAAN